MKELFQTNPYEIQQKIWGKTIRPEGIAKRVSLAQKGWLPQGISLAEMDGNIDKISSLVGDFSPRIAIFSNPNNLNSLLPEQIAVAGGWCALRTKDVVLLSNSGSIMNPATGKLKPVTSVEQVADWIEQSVAFDQIVESVGAVNASEFTVISERKLWTLRIISKLESILNTSLLPDQRSKIEKSVENAEQIRALLTKRYIQYVTLNENVIFRRVIDEDIWEGLERSRDEMLAKAGLSLSRLMNLYPKEKASLPYSSLVWAMYAEPYFDMLRQEGYMTKTQVFIVEPSLHAAAETQSEQEIALQVFRYKGSYFDPKGFNPNTGFMAYFECVNADGKNVRKELGVGQVPNIKNWESLFEESGQLNPANNSKIVLSENQLFLWGANIFPFRNVKNALIALSDLTEEFKKERAKIVNDNEKGFVQDKISQIKEEFEKEVVKQNIIIAIELKQLFEYLTGGVNI